jgi:hypothetical protein
MSLATDAANASAGRHQRRRQTTSTHPIATRPPFVVSRQSGATPRPGIENIQLFPRAQTVAATARLNLRASIIANFLATTDRLPDVFIGGALTLLLYLW